MRITRRQFTSCLGASVFAGAPALALAQDKVVRVLVGYAPGGAADNVARFVAQGLHEAGYTAVVENKAGAGGRLAVDALLNAPADGGTLLFCPLETLSLYPHIFSNLRYDPLKDLAGVGSVCSFSFGLAVAANSPAKNLRQFLELARTTPSLASYGTPGVGTAMHFLGQMLSRESKVPLTHVAYKGGSAALADTIGGTIPALISTLPNLLPMHRAGKLRILATSGAEPDPAVPGVPTFQSAGFPALTIEESFGYFARSGTPAAAIATLSQAIIRAVHSPHVLGLLKKSEFHVQTLSPDALDREVRTEFVMWDRIVKSTGYTPEQ